MRSRSQPFPASDEQVNLQLILQLFDVITNGALANVQGLSSESDALEARYHVKHLNGLDISDFVHGRLCPLPSWRTCFTSNY